MKNIYFLLSDNLELTSKGGSIELKFQSNSESPIKQSLPIKQTYGLIVMNESCFSNQFLSLLKQEQIPVAITEPDGTPLGCFKPFGRTTSKSLLEFYKLTHYNKQSCLLLQQEIAKSAIDNYYHALKGKESLIQENLSQKRDAAIIELRNAKVEDEILCILDQYQQEIHKMVKETYKMIPTAIFNFISGLLYGLLEISVFHAQLDSTFGIFPTRKNPRSVPLIDDLMMVYEGPYFFHFYFTCIQAMGNDLTKSGQLLSIDAKRLITSAFLEFIEKSYFINSLNRPVRLLEVPKLQLYRWLKFANGINSDSPSMISLKSVFK